MPHQIWFQARLFSLCHTFEEKQGRGRKKLEDSLSPSNTKTFPAPTGALLVGVIIFKRRI